MSNHTVLLELLQKVAEELFSTYGLEASPRLPRPDDEPLDICLASIIGFSGREARGTLMLSLSPDALARTRPDGVDDRDWLAELGNQLLGRLKNRLVAWDLDITMSTPLVIHGQRLSPTMRGDHAPFRWVVTGGEAYAWFDAQFSPGYELRPSTTASAAVAEGASMLF